MSTGSDPGVEHLAAQSLPVDGQWDVLRMCSICFAVVPRTYLRRHYLRHQEQGERIPPKPERASLDYLGRPTDTTRPIPREM